MAATEGGLFGGAIPAGDCEGAATASADTAPMWASQGPKAEVSPAIAQLIEFACETFAVALSGDVMIREVGAPDGCAWPTELDFAIRVLPRGSALPAHAIVNLQPLVSEATLTAMADDMQRLLTTKEYIIVFAIQRKLAVTLVRNFVLNIVDLIADKLSARLGRQVLVERVGATHEQMGLSLVALRVFP